LSATVACNNDDNNLIVAPIGGVATFHDPNFNFATLTTFALPDTVVHLTPVNGVPLDVSRAFDQATIAQVRSNLLARGYTQAAAGTLPTFVVLVGATATDNYPAFVSYPWFSVWGFFPAWAVISPSFSSAWGIVYPYGITGVTTYARGTLLVDLIPTASVNTGNQQIKSAWTGVGTSILLQAGVTQAVINAAIDEMFAQSPYLVPGTAVPTPY
jgi:hypothetical protein